MPSVVLRLAGSMTNASRSTYLSPLSVSKMTVASVIAESAVRSVSDVCATEHSSSGATVSSLYP